MRWRKVLVWITSVAGAVVLLIAAVILSAPLWFDAEGVKTRVIGRVSKATGGHTDFERIDLHFVPLPGVTVTRPRFSLPGLLDLEAQSASIDLDLLALITARVQITSLRVAAPKIIVQLPEPGPEAEPFSIESAERALREVIAQIAERAPDIQVVVDNGSVSLQARERRPLTFDNFRLRAEVTHDHIEATLSCSSNLWDRLTLKMNLAGSELTGNGTVEVVGLRAHDLGEVFGRQEDWPVREAIANANALWQMKGLADVRAEGNLSASKVSLSFGERHLDMLRPTIDVSVQLHDGETEISVRQLVIDTPRLDATAKLTRSERGALVLQARVVNADLPALQVAAADLAPEIAILAHPPLQIEQGTITTLEVRSEAETLFGLMRPEALQAQFELAAVDALAPEYDLRIREAGGSVSLEAGELKVRNATARVGKSSLRDGNFAASLSAQLTRLAAGRGAPGAGPNTQGAEQTAQGTEPTGRGAKTNALPIEPITLIAKELALSADATLSLDLAEGLAIAKRVIRSRKIRRELAQIKQLSGRAELRASVTRSGQTPEVHLDVSEIQTTARHAAVPFPIPILLKRGAVRYVKDAIHAQDLEGAIGRTTFTGVGARFGLNAPNVLSAGKGSARLALDELMRWAAALPELKKHLGNIEKVTGSMSVSVSKLEGPLRSPNKLRYVLAASPRRTSIEAPKLGPRVEFDGGVIDISNNRIRMRDVKVSALDASMQVGGGINDYRKGLDNLQVKFDGTAGLKSLEWLRVRAGLPETVRLRNSLQLSAFEVQWHRDGEYAARGKIEVANGPIIHVAMRGSPKHVEVQNISLRDDLSDVELGGKLEATRFDLRFKGKLVEQSIARIFAEQPFELGALAGDLRVSGDLKQPARSKAKGDLHGTMIGIPGGLLFFAVPLSVTVEQFSIEARNEQLHINSATVAMGDSKLEVSGSIDGAGERFQVDADVRGDTVVIPLPTARTLPRSSASPKAGQKDEAESDIDQMAAAGEKQFTKVERLLEQIPVSGHIRVNISDLHIAGFDVTPFIATASLENARLVLDLQEARLCNILLTGELTALRRGRVSINVEVHTRNARIEQSIPCLTNQNILLTGLMDVDAKLVAAGTGAEFYDSARATYTLSARDGEIRKFDALDKVMVAVNETEAADGKLPDIKKSGLQYKSMSVKGDIDLRTLRVEEAVLEIDLAKIVAQGKVDIQTQKIDATVLVAPLKTINKIINWMPILGRIFGGSVLAVPVGVSGTIKAPVVVPLAPSAVATRTVDILTNILKLPADLLNTTSPDSKEPNPPSDTGNSGRGG